MNALLIVAAAALGQTQDAKAFTTQLNAEMKELIVRSSTAEWIKNNFITEDSERMSAAMSDDFNAYVSRKNKEARRFEGQKLDPETTRFLYLLRIASSLPAPSDAKKRAELSDIASKLDGEYGQGKWCGKGFAPGQDD